MNGPLKMLYRLFHPQVEPDPRLERAYSHVDEAAARFEAAVERARAQGLFIRWRDAVESQAEIDSQRVRRARRKL